MEYEDLDPQLHFTNDLWYTSVDDFLNGLSRSSWRNRHYMPKAGKVPVLVIGRWAKSVDESLLVIYDGMVVVVPCFSLEDMERDTIALNKVSL
jgi:hypothetical protein